MDTKINKENLPGKAFVFVRNLAERAERAEARVAELEAENEKLRVHPIGVRKQRINDLEKRLVAAIGKADHEKLSAMAFEFHAEQAIDILADDLYIAKERISELEAAQKPRPIVEAPKYQGSIRAWDPTDRIWADMKWDRDGWIASEDELLVNAERLHPTYWCEECPPDPEEKVND